MNLGVRKKLYVELKGCICTRKQQAKEAWQSKDRGTGVLWFWGTVCPLSFPGVIEALLCITSVRGGLWLVYAN